MKTLSEMRGNPYKKEKHLLGITRRGAWDEGFNAATKALLNHPAIVDLIGVIESRGKAFGLAEDIQSAMDNFEALKREVEGE